MVWGNPGCAFNNRMELKMRPIKFRAWSISEKRMLSCEDLCDGTEMLKPGSFSDVSPVMLFIGLLDKNGKEIYEGDVVKWGFDESEIGEVAFEEGMFRVNYGARCMYFNYPEAYSVIGNIYENPELVTK